MDNIFKTRPYEHQLRIFDDSKDREYCAYFLEQRCGKTKVTLDVVAHQFHARRIDALLIIAPNGVNRNWLVEEIPTHLHDSTNYRSVLWRSGRMKTKTAIHDLDQLLCHPGLAILSVNVDALVTDTLKTYLTQFFKKRKVFAVVDESIDISSPGATRTKVALRVGIRAISRRILDGTPVAAAPLGLYSQSAFLKPGLLGNSYFAFKHRYAEWETKDVGQRNKPCPDCEGNGVKKLNDSYSTCERCKGSCFVGNKSFPSLKNYQNLDELTDKLSSFSYRVRRDQCADLPPKIYTKHFFDLSESQQHVYNDLRTLYAAALANGEIVTAPMALTRLLRLQQVASNFLPLDAQSEVCAQCYGEGCMACQHNGIIAQPHRIGTIDYATNPRLTALERVIAPLEGQGIIWCRFTKDVSDVCGLLPHAVRYDGQMDADARGTALAQFQAGEARYLVGTAQAGGRGLDLSGANHVIYYSHSWSLRQRLQSEDRAQSLKKTDSVLYIDLIAADTVDAKIVAALRAGRDLSALVLGDPRIFT